MSRTPKKSEPISKDALLRELARIRISHDVLQDAIVTLKDGESIDVEYLSSLSRGADSLKTFTDSLNYSLAVHKARSLAAGVAAEMNRRASDVRHDAEPSAEDIAAIASPRGAVVGRRSAKKASTPTAAQLKKLAESSQKPTKKAKRG